MLANDATTGNSLKKSLICLSTKKYLLIISSMNCHISQISSKALTMYSLTFVGFFECH